LTVADCGSDLTRREWQPIVHLLSICPNPVRRTFRGRQPTVQITRGGGTPYSPEEAQSMSNYLLTYYGGGMPETKEEQDSVMAAWGAWFGQLGDALVDGGNPVSKSKAISPDGSVMDATSAPSGYTIIKADDLDSAVALAKGCPVLGGGAALVVSETFAAM